MERVKIY